jgi:hypothetical protein
VSIPPDGDNQFGVTFHNNDGDWTMWKGCWSYFNGSGQLTTIGPGYVGRLYSGGRLVFNDEAGPPGGLNAYQGGLGVFGFHYTRGNAPYELDHPFYGRFTTDISNRHCSSNGSSGVYKVDIRQSPTVSGGVEGRFDVTVWIRDQWGNTGAGPNDPQDPTGNPAGDAGIRLDYDTRVYASVVKQWATVTVHFAPNYEGVPYVKEPKFKAAVPNSTVGYRRISIYGGTSGTEPIKTFTGNLPQGSRHSYENNRLRVRYDFGTTDVIGSHGCNGTIKPCLNVLFRAVPSGGGWSLWEGANGGLDRWALDAAALSPLRNEDAPNAKPENGPDTPWHCNGADRQAPFTTPPASPSHQGVRGWEFGGLSGGAYQPYSYVGTLATGWEGGRGAFDCEPLYRPFQAGKSYSVEMDYSIDAGW